MATLADIATYVKDKISSTSIVLEDYVTTDNILQNKQGIELASNLPPVPCSLTRFEEGDILVGNIRPYLRKIWYAERPGGCSNDVLVFRAKDKVLSKYLYSILLNDRFFDYIMLAPKGAKMPRGEANHIMRYPIVTLSKDNAIKVGDSIKEIDDKININKKENAILSAMAKQLYDYWFVQFDFPDANGRPYKTSGGKMVWNETLKREIPEGWSDASLSDTLDLFDYKRVPVSSKDRVKGVYPYYGATGIMDYVNDYIFDGDYLLLAEDGSTNDGFDHPIVQFIWGKTWVNNHAHIIRPKREDDLHFTYYLLKNIPLKNIESGSIQKKVSHENLLKHKTIQPSSDVITRYCKLVKPYWDQYKRLTDETNILLKQREFILPLLMTGQVTIG